MPNSPSVPIFKVINALLSKIYYLLQIMLFCSILQQHDQFLKRDPSESLQNDELSMCTNFGSNQCITFQIIWFAANNAILQHFAATWLYCEKETLLNQFRMSTYPCVPSLVIINELLPKLFIFQPFPALYLKKVLQLQQQQQQQKIFNTVILVLIQNEEKSMNFRKKFQVV